jgi:hypothetical protein
MQALGPNWAFILTDVTKGREGNQERMAFLFDLRRARPSSRGIRGNLRNRSPAPHPGGERLTVS